MLLIASWLACRLPERLLVPLAEFAGDLWYRATPDRAAQARRNLRRVAEDLARRGRGTPGVRAAATDPRALERLVRLAYRHAARYYLEVVRTPGLRPGDVDERMDIETPDLVADAFTPGRASIFVGLHFGAIELPAILLASRVGGAVAPMETIDDPRLQDWFVRTRGAVGVRIVGLREARRELQAALRAGTSVGLVGDRDLTGGGVLTELFGAPAQLPLGPAMLGVESGAPLFVMGVRRTGIGRYKGRLELVTTPTDGSRRERVTTTMAGIARAFERIVEDAPEQWWAVFFPIWPDLERRGGSSGRSTRGTRGAVAGGAHDMTEPPATERHGRADLHIHTIASDGIADVASILDHVAARGDLDVIAITDHERIDAAVAAQAMARDRGVGIDVVVGEEVTTLGGHLLALWIDRPIRPYRSLRNTIKEVHAAGGLAIPAHPLVPYPLCAQGRVLRNLLDDGDETVRPDGLETFNPTALGRPWHDRVVRFADEHGLARVGNSDAHALDAIGAGWTTFEGRTAEELRRAIEARETDHEGSFHDAVGQVGVFGKQLTKRARDARDELAGRVRRDGTGRDHGYPGGRARPPRYDPADERR